MEKSIATLLASVILALIIGAVATYGFQKYQQEDTRRSLSDLISKLLNVEKIEEELGQTKNDLLGSTKYTDYVSVTKTALEKQSKFLAAKVDREYVHVEHIQKSAFGLDSEATIILKYNVEYSFGYDLRPGSFAITGDRKGITITLNKPEMVASPAVSLLSHEIPSKGLFIDEKGAIIALQQQLSSVAKKRADDLKGDEAVIALCEKKLGEFLREFLMRQPNVRGVPVIRVAYR